LRPRIQAPTARGKIVVDPNCPVATAEHRLKRACRINPFVQLRAADAQRVVQILTGTGPISVERYAEAVNAKFGHSVSFCSQTVDPVMCRAHGLL